MPLILQNIKIVPFLVFVLLANLSSAGVAGIKHYSKTTLLSHNSCSLSQTNWATGENKQAVMFQEKSTLFCQIEIFKLLALCCNVNFNTSSRHATFSTSLRLYRNDQYTQELTFQCLTEVICYQKTDFWFKVFLQWIMKQRKQMFWTSRLQQTVFVLMYTF